MSTDDTPKLAKWKDGVVDEPWKRRVILADRQRAIRTVNGLGTILFGSVFPGVAVTDFEGQCEVLRKLSGDQIASAMLDYWKRIGRQLEASKQFAVKGEQWGIEADVEANMRKLDNIEIGA